jgi:asparagine synthetase B (glutamine-hydrolysing)
MTDPTPTMKTRIFHRDVMTIDLEERATTLGLRLRDALRALKRRGVVVAVSGGIDSACVLALAVRAVGPDHVHALLLPESSARISRSATTSSTSPLRSRPSAVTPRAMPRCDRCSRPSTP